MAKHDPTTMSQHEPEPDSEPESDGGEEYRDRIDRIIARERHILDRLAD